MVQGQASSNFPAKVDGAAGEKLPHSDLQSAGDSGSACTTGSHTVIQQLND
jgi:hypothetical protein